MDTNNYYRPKTKLRESNVFTGVPPSVILSERSRHRTHGGVPPQHQTLGPNHPPPLVASGGDLETSPNLFIWGPQRLSTVCVLVASLILVLNLRSRLSKATVVFGLN